MDIYRTIKIKLTDEEAGAIQTLYNMINELGKNEEETLADELGYYDLDPIRSELEQLWQLSGRETSTL